MATTIEPRLQEPLGPQIIVPSTKRAPIAQPLGWASIFAAAVIAVGVSLLLHLFGLGVGLTSIETDDASSLRGVGIGTGIWTIVAPIIALFVAGLVAGRTAPTLNSWNAAIHGAAAWAVTAIISLLLIGMTLGALARGASATVTTVANVAAIPLSLSAEHASRLSTLGIDTDDLVARLNQELARKGMPPVKAEDINEVVRETIETAVRQGGIDRETIVSITAKRTALSRDDANQLASELEQQMRAALTRTGAAAESAGEMALQAMESTGKLVLFLSIAMALGLAAAMGGAVLAVRRERREYVVTPRP